MALQTALVVDDSKLARITLQRLLQKHDLKVELAESGTQAIEILTSLNPDIIFMDHLMPELDGFEATKKIKANPDTAHIPVIMCTGKEGVDNYDEQARGIGASGTLSKPPQPEQLAVVLKAAQSGENLVHHRKAEEPAETLASAAAPSTTPEPAAPAAPEQTAKATPETRPSPAAAPAPAAPPAEDVAATSPQPVQPAKDWTEDISKLAERLYALESVSPEIPSFDSFEQRMSDTEGSLNTLQESMISLKETISGQLAKPDSDLQQKVQQMEASLQTLQQQIGDLSNSIPSPAEIGAAIRPELESVWQNEISAAVESLRTETQASIPENIDTREVTAKVVQEVERAITPLLEEEIRSLEKRLSVTIDEAVSESRKDLDDQLSESIREAELQSRPIPQEPDLENLIERIRADISDIATHTATAAVDVNLEDRLATFKEQIEATKSELRELSEADSGGVQLEDVLHNEKLHTMIEGTVEELLRVQISKQGQELVQQIARALKEQTEEKQQEVSKMAEKLDHLEQTNIQLLDRINDMEEQSLLLNKGSSANNSGMLIGVAGLLTAVVALAKAFGIF